jgi:electron transfer flavoprotein alpha subunit
MSVALVLVEHEGGAVKDATLATVTAAAKLGDVHLLVAGEGVGGVAEAAAKIAGVSTVHVADGAAFAHNLAENVAPVAVALVNDHCDYFVVPATTTGKNIAPRVAALLDVMQISDILSVEGPDTFTRPIYAGNAIATVKSSDAKKVITVRTTAFEKAAREGGSGSVGSVSGSDAGLSAFVGAELSKSERPELTSAKVIVSGGRAFGSSEQFHALLDPLADKLKAGVGASRAAVDAGYAPNDYQVGQTGKIVAPEVYIAIGISGAIQHLAGMKDSKVIVAINKDEEAPIFQVADYGLVGDLFQILPELEKALTK